MIFQRVTTRPIAVFFAAGLFGLSPALAQKPAATPPSSATQQPSARAVALAKEVVTIKGAALLYDTLVPGVVEHAKNMFLQTNPMIGKDLNDVAGQLRKDLTPRQVELIDEAARLYATRFTEAELTEIVNFYKTNTGKKVITEEPRILDQSMTSAQNWANKLSDEVIAKFRSEMKKKGHDL